MGLSKVGNKLSNKVDSKVVSSKIKNVNDKVSKITKKQKIVIIVISAFIFINVVVGFIFYSVSKSKSYVQLENCGIGEDETLVALNGSARKGVINGGHSASFKFSDEQKEALNKLIAETGNVSINVRIQIEEELPSGLESTFQYGYLLKDDFNSKGKYMEKPYSSNNRTLIHGNLANAPKIFDVSFAIKNNNIGQNDLPEGFFIYSSVDCKIVSACAVPVEIGFDASRNVPFYGFSCNGGIIDFTNKSFDFSGAALVYPTKTSSIASLPEYIIKLSPNPAFKSTPEKGAVYSYLNFGGEMVKIHNVIPAEEVVIPAGGLKTPFSNMKIDNNAMCITSVLMRPTNIAGKKVLKPVRTDPGLILNYRTSTWRTVDYELFEWDRYPKILFFDTRNYNIQDNFFRRLAYFVEKNGYKGRILSNAELEGKHGYNAHDYSAISMADFFNKAYDAGFQLNKEELLLKEILIENELFTIDGNYVIPNEGGIVSISQESTPKLRETFLAHEGWHTIFFKDEEFRNFVSAVYWTLDPYAREWLSDYFTANPSLQYDTNDDYLINNEFMAYIMQQPLSEVADYFVSLAQRSYVHAYTPELSDYIIKTQGRAFEDAAIAMNDFVFDKYGLVCGNICLVDKK